MTRKRGKLYVLLSLVLALALFSLAAPYLTPNDPAAATVVTVMLFHLLGDCVRDCAAVEEQR